MSTTIADVKWIGSSEQLESMVSNQETVHYEAMDYGQEAEVVLVKQGKERYVLKVWNKYSKPNVNAQYKLLSTLFSQNRAVSKPYGWGTTEDGHSALLTSFDGGILAKLKSETINELALILHRIHTTSLVDIAEIELPKHDFYSYFFYGIDQYPDLQHTVKPLIASLSLEQSYFIHGDFHPRNVVEHKGKYCVIDWTNGQLGDYRFDVAWSVLLQSVYISEKVGKAFLSAYSALQNIKADELEQFEALACMRWMLLHRLSAVPIEKNTLKRVKRISLTNPYLRDFSVEVAL